MAEIQNGRQIGYFISGMLLSSATWLMICPLLGFRGQGIEIRHNWIPKKIQYGGKTKWPPKWYLKFNFIPQMILLSGFWFVIYILSPDFVESKSVIIVYVKEFNMAEIQNGRQIRYFIPELLLSSATWLIIFLLLGFGGQGIEIRHNWIPKKNRNTNWHSGFIFYPSRHRNPYCP